MGQTPALFPKYKIESRALIHFALRPDLPTMFPDDTLHGGKPHTCSLKLLRPMEALEDPEQLVCVSFVEACAVVSNKDHRGILLLHLSNLDDGKFAPPGIFDGVRKQVQEHLSHQARVALDGGQVSEAPIDLTAATLRLEIKQHVFH